MLPRTLRAAALIVVVLFGSIACVTRAVSGDVTPGASDQSNTLDRRLTSSGGSNDPDADFDIVIRWVNSTDPAYIKQRAKHTTSVIPHDLGGLVYSIRSIVKHMPWWKGTVFVLSEQYPCWLKPNHPRVKVVPLLDLFGDEALLPTYNAFAVYSLVNRIKGIRPRFVLMPETFLLTAPLTPQDFFNKGKPVFRLESWKITGGLQVQRSVRNRNVNQAVDAHTRGMLETYLTAHRPGVPLHEFAFHPARNGPVPMELHRMNKLWETFAEELDNQRRSRIMDWHGVLTKTLHCQFCLLAEDDACDVVPMEQANKELMVFTVGTAKAFVPHFMNALLSSPPKFTVINNNMGRQRNQLSWLFQTAFPHLFPTPAEWEQNLSCQQAPIDMETWDIEDFVK